MNKIFTALFLALNIMPVLAMGPFEKDSNKLSAIDTNVVSNTNDQEAPAEEENLTQSRLSPDLINKKDLIVVTQEDIKNNQNTNVATNKEKIEEGKSCKDTESHIKKGIYYKNKQGQFLCIPTECDKGFVTSEDGRNCMECDIAENAISMTSKNDKCVIKECNDGYKEKDGKCVEKTKNSKDDENDDKDASKPKKVDPEEMAKKQKAYDDAKANEQSMANRTLTAATTAATGIGAMEALQGLAEQKSDKAADASMNAYISTMRCKYGNTSVKAGMEEIELPGGNDENMMKYRAEYIALATDLKERKSALNMAPGIENIEILDKSTMGLYDDESVGITSGNYSSLYRAKALGSESDQAQIDDAAKTSKTRVIAGATAAGVGVVGGVAGNFIINNQETRQRIEEAKSKRNARQLQNTALNRLKSCLAEAGVTGTNSLEFKNLVPTTFTLDGINCKNDLTNLKGKKAQDLFADTTDENVLCEKLRENFKSDIAKKLAGCDEISENLDNYNGYTMINGDYVPTKLNLTVPAISSEVSSVGTVTTQDVIDASKKKTNTSSVSHNKEKTYVEVNGTTIPKQLNLTVPAISSGVSSVGTVTAQDVINASQTNK